MSFRKRVQVAVVLSASAVLAVSLTSFAPTAVAQRQQLTPRAEDAARTAAITPGARAGASAGRKAGAVAGAKAGRRAGQKAGGAKGATAGAAAGRTAGAKAGAQAGRAVGAKRTAAAGRTAGARAGAKAGARAGAAAGRAAGRAALGPYCGTTVFYKPNGARWQCSLADDFTGSSLNKSLWRVMTSDDFNFGSRKDCFTDRARNVYVADGALNLVARREGAALTCHRGTGTYRTPYTSGMVSSYQKWSQAYGRFEFRARFPHSTLNGLQTSLWLWPQGATGATWPVSGEIDVAEWYSQFDDRVVPYLHYAGLDTSSATNNQCLVSRVQDWHTYLLEWQPGSIRISYDGQTCLENTRAGAPFDKPYLMAMFGGFGLKRNAPTATTPGYNRTQVAWVRVWR